jgi:hypothetical protein
MSLLLFPLSLCMQPCCTLTVLITVTSLLLHYCFTTLQASMISQLERNRGELEEQVCFTSTCYRFNQLNKSTVMQ